jgi:hypothetical protein
MGELRFEGVKFFAFPGDHNPPHVHGFYGEVGVIVDLNPDRTVVISDRKDAVKPPNGKRADIRHVTKIAAKHYDELIALWGRRI